MRSNKVIEVRPFDKSDNKKRGIMLVEFEGRFLEVPYYAMFDGAIYDHVVFGIAANHLIENLSHEERKRLEEFLISKQEEIGESIKRF